MATSVHPAADGREVVELLRPQVIACAVYRAGHQFAVIKRRKVTLLVVDGDGPRIVVRADRVRTVRPAAPPRAKPALALAALVAGGVLRPAAELAGR
jgi:hypothetical protein